jgi:hypothetical protein
MFFITNNEKQYLNSLDNLVNTFLIKLLIYCCYNNLFDLLYNKIIKLLFIFIGRGS